MPSKSQSECQRPKPKKKVSFYYLALIFCMESKLEVKVATVVFSYNWNCGGHAQDERQSRFVIQPAGYHKDDPNDL